jgi:hypothetical protein
VHPKGRSLLPNLVLQLVARQATLPVEGPDSLAQGANLAFQLSPVVFPFGIALSSSLVQPL